MGVECQDAGDVVTEHHGHEPRVVDLDSRDIEADDELAIGVAQQDVGIYEMDHSAEATDVRRRCFPESRLIGQRPVVG